jgi:Protein of unknown function (DUF3102)
VLAPATNQLDALRNRVIAEHVACGYALGTALLHAMNAGDALLEARKQIDHGGWLPWLASCGLSPRLAQRYMRLARYRSVIEANASDLSHLSVTNALALLAAPKKEAAAVDLSQWTLDPLATMRGEIEYSLGLARDAWPEADDETIRRRADRWRATLYWTGSWEGHAAGIVRLEEEEKKEAERMAAEQKQWRENERARAKKIAARAKKLEAERQARDAAREAAGIC